MTLTRSILTIAFVVAAQQALVLTGGGQRDMAWSGSSFERTFQSRSARSATSAS